MRPLTFRYFWGHREDYPYSLNELYKSMNISKQAVYKQLVSRERQREVTEYVRRIVEQVRADHPTMGVRDIYYKMQPKGIGRDKFEGVCRETGLMACRRVNPCRTTDSTGVVRFPNLLEDLVVTELNQVWQSDITYFEVDGKFYYLTFILDASSRRILGYSVSKHLFTEETVMPAFTMALRTRGVSKCDGLIFHSDGGGQYYSNKFLNLTAKCGIRNSMCLYSWENGKAERVNGVIKNNYLVHRSIRGFEELVKEVDRAVALYNNEKPHIKLHRMSPVQFEKNFTFAESDFTAPGDREIRLCNQKSRIEMQKIINKKVIVNKRQTVNLI